MSPFGLDYEFNALSLIELSINLAAMPIVMALAHSRGCKPASKFTMTWSQRKFMILDQICEIKIRTFVVKLLMHLWVMWWLNNTLLREIYGLIPHSLIHQFYDNDDARDGVKNELRVYMGAVKFNWIFFYLALKISSK